MVSKRKSKANKDKATTDAQPALNIPEEEQWRLINESGILNQIPQSAILPTRPKEKDLLDETAEPSTKLCDEILNACFLIIPLSTVLMMMEILIHHQYGQTASAQDIVDRMASGIPLISLFVFYTNRHKRKWPTQLLLFIVANLAGPRLIYLINKKSWKIVMNQCPPLITIWVCTIIQLDLGRAILNLIIVAIWVRWKGLKLSFY